MMRDVGLPEGHLEDCPELSNRADHVKIELRSKRDGKPVREPKQQRDSNPVRESKPVHQAKPARDAAKPAPDLARPARSADEAEWRSSTAGPSGADHRPRRGTGPTQRVKGAAQQAAPGQSEGERFADPLGEDDGPSRRAPSAPRGPKPAGKGSRSGGKAQAKSQEKSKRSGKPRPKNKSSRSKKG